MKKRLVWLILGLVAGFVILLLLEAMVALAVPAIVPAIMPAAIIVPAEKVAVIVPAIDIIPGVPQVTFVGITAVSPVDLAKFQNVSNNLVVTFDEAMDPSTMNENTLLLLGQDNTALKGRITSDATRKIWTFNPTDLLEPDSLYTLTVTAGAKGVSGNSLKNDFVLSFTTSP